MPLILKTILFLPMILALGYSFIISFEFFHRAFSASWYHDFNACSQSGYLLQKSRSTFFAITLKQQILTKIGKSSQNGNIHSNFINCSRCTAGLECLSACLSRGRSAMECRCSNDTLHQDRLLSKRRRCRSKLYSYTSGSARETEMQEQTPCIGFFASAVVGVCSNDLCSRVEFIFIPVEFSGK